MKAILEITGGIIRVFARDTAQHGDPFDFALAFSADETVVTLKALAAGDARLPLCVIQAVRDELRRHGFDRVRWSRRGADGAKLRDFEMDLTRE